ncbi:hypothetical protein ACFPOA_12675 [Lysobacter niabensis]|uniref:hypothetical protein n=1 Tax=Agrilutibacter niabensis TaxID=380628 RepID=UPI00361EDEEC
MTWGLSKHSVWVEKGCRAVFSNAQDNASMPGPSSHGLPGFNATCPGNMSVHGDDGGYVYVNGNAASVKKFNDNYYEAKGRCRGLPGSLPRRDPAGWIAARDDCEVVEAKCTDDADTTHDLRVATSIEAGPALEPGCGELHLPNPP